MHIHLNFDTWFKMIFLEINWSRNNLSKMECQKAQISLSHPLGSKANLWRLSKCLFT
jgi:hypothetical protein